MDPAPTISLLLVEPNTFDISAFQAYVRDESLPYDYTVRATAQDALLAIERQTFDVMLVDHTILNEMLAAQLDLTNSPPAIVTAPLGQEASAVAAIKAGAADYLIMDDQQAYLALLSLTIDRVLPRNASPIARIGQDAEQKLDEKKLVQNELRFYHEILENIAEGIHLIRIPDGTFLYANPTFEQMFGYEPGELIGQHVSILNSPSAGDPAETAQTIMTAVTEQGFWKGEIANVKKCGARINCRAKVVAFDHSEHGPVWLTVQEDITEQVNARQALQASEERYQSIIRSQTHYLLRTDLEGRLTFWNDKYEALFGWLHEESGMAGAQGLESVCEHHHARLIDTVTQCLSEPGRVVTVELDKPIHDGSVLTTLWEFVCLTDPQGAPTELQCMGVDITERNSTLEQLQQSEKRYRQMFELIRLPKLIVSPETGAIIDANPAAVEFYGYPLETLTSMSMMDINQADPDEISKKIHEVLPGNATSCDFVQKLADGTLRDVEVFSGPIDFEDQQALYSIYVDVTDRKYAEAALKDANTTLEERVYARTRELVDVKNQIEAVLNNSADGILRLDLDLNVLDANATSDLLFGMNRADYLGLSLTTFGLREKDTQAIDEALQHIQAHKVAQRLEVQFSPSDITFAAELSLSPILDSEENDHELCLQYSRHYGAQSKRAPTARK